MGGDFGAELVKAGFSHLVITGKSEGPVYLLIRDNKVEICDAHALQGLDTIGTQKSIRAELGDESIQVACIGPAGENLVRFASIRSGMKSSAGRTGMGAVMGSKNLKAVAVRGTLDIKISDPETYLKSYLRYLKKFMATKWAQALGKQGTPLLFRLANAMGFLSVRNNQETTVGEQGSRLEAEALEPYSTGMVACYSCPVHCRHRFFVEERGYGGEGPEYASIGAPCRKRSMSLRLYNAIKERRNDKRVFSLSFFKNTNSTSWVSPRDRNLKNVFHSIAFPSQYPGIIETICDKGWKI